MSGVHTNTGKLALVVLSALSYITANPLQTDGRFKINVNLSYLSAIGGDIVKVFYENQQNGIVKEMFL